MIESNVVLVRDDLDLPDDSGKAPKLNGVDVNGCSIPGREIIYLLDGKLARW
jgi:hypothetical protein